VLDALVHWFQGFLRLRLAEWLKQDWVRLTPVEQVHATLIGMEATLDHGELLNKNLLKASRGRGEPRPMELGGFARYLHRVGFPIRLRFGGFAPDAVNPYDARPPFERSFTIRPDGLIVAIGWPMRNEVIQPALVDLRKGAEDFQIVHKYHESETDRDNDAFLVLGAVTPMPWEGEGKPWPGFEGFLAALSETQEGIRESLPSAALEVAMSREHCTIVRYRSADLAGVPERDILPLEAVTAEGLQRLYF
jgi:hypothetical protein